MAHKSIMASSKRDDVKKKGKTFYFSTSSCIFMPLALFQHLSQRPGIVISPWTAHCWTLGAWGPSLVEVKELRGNEARSVLSLLIPSRRQMLTEQVVRPTPRPLHFSLWGLTSTSGQLFCPEGPHPVLLHPEMRMAEFCIHHGLVSGQ